MRDTQTMQIQFDFANESPIVEQPVEKLSSKEEEKFVFEFMDTLTAPIITFSEEWASAIPERLKRDITLSRLIGKMQNEELSTIPETVAYIITRTFIAPLSHEWTNVYLWCSAQYMQQYRKKSDEDLTEIKYPAQLSRHEESLLKRLRVWIFEKRREVVKQRLKQSTQNNTKNDTTN